MKPFVAGRGGVRGGGDERFPGRALPDSTFGFEIVVVSSDEAEELRLLQARAIRQLLEDVAEHRAKRGLLPGDVMPPAAGTSDAEGPDA